MWPHWLATFCCANRIVKIASFFYAKCHDRLPFLQAGPIFDGSLA